MRGTLEISLSKELDHMVISQRWNGQKLKLKKKYYLCQLAHQNVFYCRTEVVQNSWEKRGSIMLIIKSRAKWRVSLVRVQSYDGVGCGQVIAFVFSWRSNIIVWLLRLIHVWPVSSLVVRLKVCSLFCWLKRTGAATRMLIESSHAWEVQS